MRRNLVLLLTAAMLLTTFVLPSHAQTPRKTEKATPQETGNKASVSKDDEDEDEDPDLPSIAGAAVNKQEFLLRRDEQINFLRGFPYPHPDARVRAIYAMRRQEIALEQNRTQAAAAATWRAIGPAPIPNGQTTTISSPVSGRTTVIAVHPTNPNIAYVGTAQGGLYRTLDGGATWTPLLDGALSLAIGSIAIAPSDPTIVYVGTGEPSLSGDSFFGVGIYRITTADTTPVVAGPISLDGVGNDVFLGRAVSKIVVHPTNPSIIFAATTSGIGGISGSQPNTAPLRGLYRSTNALAGSPTFTKLTVATAAGGDRSITDIVLEPGNPNNLVCAVYGLAGAGDGGIYLTTNALDAAPTFTQTLPLGDTGFIRAQLAINKVGMVTTVLAATGTNNGELRRSLDGGATWSAALPAANAFCNPQCFYDIAVAIDPNNANVIYLGGSAGSNILKKSTDGGTSFGRIDTGLHADTHAVTVAPSDSNVVYFGSDGGIWKSANAGANFTSLNNSSYSATQFESIALHPLDRYFTIGGTQDNGTEFLRPDNTWVRAVGGDGGRTVIDQNATDNVNVTMYHTFFNQTNNQIGFNRILTVNPTGTLQSGSFLGCTGTTSNNGIGCSDQVLFYAPFVRGPGNPNTLYFGTDRLYRSDNKGATMTLASQAPFGARVSAIGISPQNDNIRIIGLTNGQVFATNTGSTTLTNITGPIPANKYVARTVIDPNNPDIAYVALSAFGVADGQHIWKTSNLSSAAPTWTASGSGIPDVPVSAFVIDPNDTNSLYAGTDIGVYRSKDAGQTWLPFSNGLPRVAVFDMAIHKTHRFLRIATHGRGMFEIDLRAGSAVADFDGDGKSDVSVFRPSNGGWYVLRSSDSGFTAQAFGQSGDKIAPGDYDGDGKADFTVFRPADATWYMLKSSNGAFSAVQFGQSADVPVAGDYDGDGKTDLAVFRPSNSTWYVQQSTAGFRAQAWGTGGDNPAPGDFDGDGKTDLAVFRPSNGTWYILESSAGAVRSQAFGMSGDKPVAGDYDGDGKTDLAVFRPSDRTWYLQQSTAGFSGAPFGLTTDIAAPGDFDGDGKTDLAVFRPSDGTWYIQQSTAGFRATPFGMNGDVPVPSGYVP